MVLIIMNDTPFIPELKLMGFLAWISVRRNISLVFDFLRYLIDHPELLDKISDGCELEFIDKDFPLPELKAPEGEKKVFLKVNRTFDLNA